MRYDDEAMVYGMRERIARGALELPKVPANLTMQHDRALPLGLLKWQDDDDAMRFSTILTAGARQDQALQDIASGLIRGASLEFIPRETKDEGEASDPVMLVKRASVLRALAGGRRRLPAEQDPDGDGAEEADGAPGRPPAAY